MFGNHMGRMVLNWSLQSTSGINFVLMVSNHWNHLVTSEMLCARKPQGTSLERRFRKHCWLCGVFFVRRGWGREVIPRQSHWCLRRDLHLPSRYSRGSYHDLSTVHPLLSIFEQMWSTACGTDKEDASYPSAVRNVSSTDHTRCLKAHSTLMPLSTTLTWWVSETTAAKRRVVRTADLGSDHTGPAGEDRRPADLHTS